MCEIGVKSLHIVTIVFDVLCEQARNYAPRAKKVKSWEEKKAEKERKRDSSDGEKAKDEIERGWN